MCRAVRGRNLGRTSSIGSRSSSFSVGHAGMAAAADTAQALASFPPPQSPAQPMQGRLGSPPLPTESEAESEAGGGLPESLSAASLVSLSSDGSFAPTLMALVEGASPQPPQLLSAAPSQEIEAAPAAEEVAADEPGTPKGGSDGADGVGAAGSSSAAAAAQPGGAAPIPTPPVRPGPKRSPLLSSSHRAAKLESFDKMLSRQPVAHVRLTAPDRPSKPSALGWLSPSKASQQAAAGKEKLKPAAAAAVAAAAATVAAAGVEAAGPGVCIPRGGLQRSNSDPSMASSLGPVPLPVPAPAAAAGAPRGRRVTFDGSATVLGPAGAGVGLARHSAGGGGLLRHSTAPSGTLSQLAEAAAAGGLGPALSGCGPGQVLLLMEPASDLAGGGMRRRVSYHSLAGLNLEGAAAAEASIKQGAGERRAGARPALGMLVLPGGTCSLIDRQVVAASSRQRGMAHRLACRRRCPPSACLQWSQWRSRLCPAAPSRRAASGLPALPACARLHARAPQAAAAPAAPPWAACRAAPLRAHPLCSTPAPACWAPAPPLAAPA